MAQARRYLLVTGSYYILYPDLPRNGPQPDGDTINFLPDNEDLIENLPRFADRSPERKHLGTYRVRFEGLDALETHYLNRHQNLEFAFAARARMLELLGFKSVEFWENRPSNVKSAQPHPLRGYLLALGVESERRVLAQVYPGEPPNGLRDGDPVFVDQALLDRGANAALVREGHGYAELYSTMPVDLVRHMRHLAKEARSGGKGLWPHEALNTERSARLNGLADLPQLVFFPKLYRRLVRYFLKVGDAGLAGFDGWVRSDPDNNDDRVLLPTGELGNMHDVYDVRDGAIRLKYLPEDLLFVSG